MLLIGLYFVSFVIATTFVLFNVVVAVLLEKVIDSSSPSDAAQVVPMPRDASASANGLCRMAGLPLPQSLGSGGGALPTTICDSSGSSSAVPTAPASLDELRCDVQLLHASCASTATAVEALSRAAARHDEQLAAIMAALQRLEHSSSHTGGCDGADRDSSRPKADTAAAGCGALRAEDTVAARV